MDLIKRYFNKRELACKIREARIKRKLTVREAAAQMELSYQTLYDIEDEEYYAWPNETTLNKLHKLFPEVFESKDNEAGNKNTQEVKQ